MFLTSQESLKSHSVS